MEPPVLVLFLFESGRADSLCILLLSADYIADRILFDGEPDFVFADAAGSGAVEEMAAAFPHGDHSCGGAVLCDVFEKGSW